MFRRTPKYTVTTAALAFIAVAAFGLKFASQYLPEKRPNRLDKEYGEYTRRSIRETVDWYGFEAQPFELAKAQGKIVFLDIGTVASLSAKRFSEDYATDGEYRQLLHDHFEAIKVDAMELPWLVDALSLEAHSFIGAERFLAIAMDHTGGVIDWAPLRPREGENSLASWLEELARLRYSDMGEVGKRASASLRRRKELARATLAPGNCTPDSVFAWSQRWLEVANSGVFGREAALVSTLPMELLLAYDDEAAHAAGLNLMLDLGKSPSYDAVDGGFFAMARAPLWRRPVAAKRTGHSLLTAAAFAEAGTRFNLPLFNAIASKTVEWALAREEGGIFDSGLSTDQVGDDSSPYYGFSEGDLDGLPLTIGELGFARIHGSEGFANSVGEATTKALTDGAAQLQKLRRRRPTLRTDAGQYANQNGQAISGIFRIGRALNDPALSRRARKVYTSARTAFVLPLGDVFHAAAGQSGRQTGYLESYVWFARAALDGYLATGETALLEDAQLITDRMLELFGGEPGAQMQFLPSLLSLIAFDMPVYRIEDTDVASANSVAVMNLSDLAAFTGRPAYRNAAKRIVQAFSGRFGSAPAPAGLVLAARRIFEPLKPPAKK